MLILSRKTDETIIIDGQIELQILKIKGNTVRIGVKAPRDVKVLRGELLPFELDLKLEDFIGQPTDEEESSVQDSGTIPDLLPNPFAVANAV